MEWMVYTLFLLAAPLSGLVSARQRRREEQYVEHRSAIMATLQPGISKENLKP